MLLSNEKKIRSNNVFFAIMVVMVFIFSACSEKKTTEPGQESVFNPPQNLQVLNTSQNYVQLVWQPPITGSTASLTGYEIYRSSTSIQTTDANTLSSTVTNLVPNTSYTFYVVAKYGSNDSRPSNTVTITTTHGAPRNLEVSNISHNSVRLSWQAPEGNTSSLSQYHIYVNNQLRLMHQNTTTLFVDIPFLELNTTFNFYIVAQYGHIQSPASETVTATTLTGSPRNLQIFDITSDSARLVWEEAESGTDGFVYYYIYMNGIPAYTSVLNPTSTTHTFTNLSPDTTYTFYVVGMYNVGMSLPSNEVTITTLMR